MTGVLDDATILETSDSLRADPEFDPEYAELLDATQADVTQISTGAIRTQTEKTPLYSSKSRRAVVVPTELGYGMARMFELLLGGGAGEVRVFYSLKDAEAWVDPDKPDPPPLVR